MTRPAWLLLLAGLVALGSTLVMAHTLETRARVRLDQARHQFLDLSAQARTVIARRSARVVATSRRPDTDLVASLNAALIAVQLPTERIAAVQPREDLAEQGSALRWQRVNLDLRPMTPKELGSFLAAWRGAGSPWRVQELTLSALRGEPDSEPPFQATLLLTAPYLSF